jgi:pyruvate dehydrogenase E2 component (dihydrolipoyllysine-residue acetyltransferase)
MATELKVPTLGMDMEEATIVRWLVEEGAEVQKGDPILEIDTDKTSFEIEAPADGAIRAIRGEVGETLPVGATLAYVTAPGEEIPEEPTPTEAALAEPAAQMETRREIPQSQPAVADLANGRKVRASPAARRAAAQLGVSIDNVPGSGPYGRIYLSDVLGMEAEAPAEAPPAEPAPTDAARREPLSRIRRLGAERTARSFSEVPHFYLTRDMEADRLVDLVQRLRGRMDPAPSLTELLVLAVSRTLKNHPRLNGRYADGDLEVHEDVNVGVAVATDEGLVVPVVLKADTLPLRELVPKVTALVRRARDHKLAPEELSGGTFTISNLGMMGIDTFDAIINTPEAAILAVGRVRTVPEWSDGGWVPRRAMSATLSVDHRVADGADGARFLLDLQEALLDWELLL